MDTTIEQYPTTQAMNAMATAVVAALAAKQHPASKPIAPPLYPIRNALIRVGRNKQCPCHSGKKFKNCCLKVIHGQAQAPDSGDMARR